MTTYVWKNAVNGTWRTNGDWTVTGFPDDATAVAAIDVPGSYIVAVEGEDDTANAVTLDAAGATLAVLHSGTVTLSGAAPTLMIDAGTFNLAGDLIGGVVQLAGGSAILENGAMLDGVTWRGLLVLPSDTTLYVVRGLTVQTASGGDPGNIDMSAGGDSLSFEDSETLDNMAVHFGGTASNSLVINGTGQTLSLGSGFTLLAGSDFGSLVNFLSDDTIANAGTFLVRDGQLDVENGSFTNSGSISVSAGSFDVTDTTFTNSGSIVVGAGGEIYLDSGFVNTGSVLIDGGLLDLFGSTTIGDLAGKGITSNAGTLEIVNTLDLGGGILDLAPSGLFSDVVVDGTLVDGTVKQDGGSVSLSDGATLDEVTWLGPLVLAPFVGLDVIGGLTVQTASGGSPGSIDLSAGFDALFFRDSETLDNVSVDFGDGSTDTLSNDNTDQTLTLGSGFTLTTSGTNEALANFAADDTITNAGTIRVSGGDLTVPGGTFSSSGSIGVSAGRLDLSDTTLSNSGSIVISGTGQVVLGSNVANTGSILIDGGALRLTAAADAKVAFGTGDGLLALDTPNDYSGTIYNFDAGDTIDLTTITYQTDGTATLLSGNTLQVIEGTSTIDLRLDPMHDYSGKTFRTAPNATRITVLCFLPGTMIATPSGRTPVERLMVGDAVVTASGAHRPISWIGTGRVLATPGRRGAATPIIVSKGAFDHQVPDHDLHVTKGHSFWFDGVLIPVEFLVNHRSIYWDDRAREVSLYHVELQTHDVLLANGAPAESYRDDGNRWLFQNGNSGWNQPAKQPCAPVLTGGPVVDAVWRRLLDRAGPRQGVPMTDDPDLHLLVDGNRVDASWRVGLQHIFRLAMRPLTMRIVSRSGVPQELGSARDPRPLGVALRQIVVSQGRHIKIIEAADARLADGFHPFEADDAIRWTNGDAGLPADLFDGFIGLFEITLRLGGSTTYVDEGLMHRVA